MKFWKIIGFIFLACIALTFWPFAIVGGIIWYLWKKKKISNPKVRYGIIAVCLLFSVFVGIGWVAALNSNSTQQQSAPVAEAKPTEALLSYKVIQTATAYDNKQPYTMSVYATENPTFTYDETKVKMVLESMSKKECTLNDCNVFLYDTPQYAQEGYEFDQAMDSNDDSKINTFNQKYPDFNETFNQHFIGMNSNGKITYYPLKNDTTPSISQADTIPGITTQSTIQLGDASLYPNHSLTPGEIFPNSTTAQVCTSGYSSSVRDVSITEKEEVFAEYGIPYSTHANYEVDHFISLELGGDNSIKNLWPELGASPNQKDKVENYLHSEVCSGKISLAEAQKEISTDWYKVYLSMIGSSTTNTTNNYPANTTSNTSASTTTTTNTSNTTQAGQATGRCNDGTETYAVNHQGACSHHQGVAQWY